MYQSDQSPKTVWPEGHQGFRKWDLEIRGKKKKKKKKEIRGKKTKQIASKWNDCLESMLLSGSCSYPMTGPDERLSLVMDMIKCIGLNKNTTHQNIWDATKVILKVKFTALNSTFEFTVLH